MRSIMFSTLLASMLVGAAVPASAGVSPISVVGENFTVFDVHEDSTTDPLPLFNPESVEVIDNLIDFDPFAFRSSAFNGETDQTKSFLKFCIDSDCAITALNFFEEGHVTLVGFGTAGTVAGVNAYVSIEILEVDGLAIVPISLGGQLTFNPTAGIYDLATNAGGGPSFTTIWTGGGSFDVQQALIDAGVSYNLGATLLKISVENSLFTATETGTSAFISKKDFSVDVTCVPEVSSSMLMGVGAAVLLVGRSLRRRRSA